MPHRALLALALLLAGACRSEISLGIPDASTTPAEGGQTVPPRCPGTPSRSVVTVMGESWGELRAIAAGAGQLHALFASPTTNEGVLARVSTSGGKLTEIARVGLDPSSLALSADGAFAFVAARGSAQVFRVDGAGRVIVGNAGGAPASIVADDQGGAYWTLPLNDGVVRWNFATAAPLTVATAARATSLRRAGGVLYLVGNRTVSAFDPRVDTAPRKLA
ncbi:MAG TPA: hypothetical protein VLT33_50685, partial [Labilithrix sp.]|nr:hypothetical protein [Labilithrix sp.]